MEKSREEYMAEGFGSERLIMRRFRQDDLRDFYEYAAEPDVGPNAGWKPHESMEESQNILDDFMKPDSGIFAITDRETGKVVGSMGLSDDPKRVGENVKEIGYVLAKPYWGRGLMTEAVKALLGFGFGKLRLEMMTVYHFPFNDRSRRVIEKCGFRSEGTLRRGFENYMGEKLDEACYSMTREEYEELFHVKQ